MAGRIENDIFKTTLRVDTEIIDVAHLQSFPAERDKEPTIPHVVDFGLT